MSKPDQNKLGVLSARIADENCYVEQVVNSIFDYVANEEFAERADAAEIVRFSSSMLENEIIFGSPDDEVLSSAQARMAENLKKREAEKPAI